MLKKQTKPEKNNNKRTDEEKKEQKNRIEIKVQASNIVDDSSAPQFFGHVIDPVHGRSAQLLLEVVDLEQGPAGDLDVAPDAGLLELGEDVGHPLLDRHFAGFDPGEEERE